VNQGKTSPPFVARTLAVYSTAVYDAVAVLSNNMRPVHATTNARQPGASRSQAGVEATISGAAYTAIKALLPPGSPALDDLLASTGDARRAANFQTGVAAANQVLAARSQDGFAAPVPPNTDFPAPPNPFPNPAMSTTVTTTCAVTKIDTWQQLMVPAVKAFTPAPDAVFPPDNYDSIANRVSCRHVQEACCSAGSVLCVSAAACQHQTQWVTTCCVCASAHILCVVPAVPKCPSM
jgi:hypothetical protein